MTTLIAEFNADGYDARAKNTGRLVTVTQTGSNVRVKIEAENPVSNSRGFVTLSDETMTSTVFELYVRPAMRNFVVRVNA